MPVLAQRRVDLIVDAEGALVKWHMRFTGIRFDDPTGLVVDGGLLLHLSRRWSLSGDVRYVPIETRSRATFGGTQSSVELNVRPLIAGFGIAYHF